MQVSEEQIELLVRALNESRNAGEVELPYEIDMDETQDYYRGMVNGLVLSHQMLIDSPDDEKRLARLMSLAAAVASEKYLRFKKSDEVLSSDELTD